MGVGEESYYEHSFTLHYFSRIIAIKSTWSWDDRLRSKCVNL